MDWLAGSLCLKVKQKTDSHGKDQNHVGRNKQFHAIRGRMNITVTCGSERCNSEIKQTYETIYCFLWKTCHILVRDPRN